MKRVVLMIISVFIYVAVFICCGFSKKGIMDDLSPYYGVWANADCEFVQTEKYTLFFERNNGKISAILRRNERSDDKIYSKFFAGFIFDVQTKEYEKITPSKDNVKIPIDDYIRLENGQLKVLQAAQVQTLQLIERLEVCPPYEMPFADSTTIGKCLQNWQIGVFDHSTDSENLHIDIGTNQHIYTFTYMTDWLYCRAARIRHNNYGSLFAQNIRLVIDSETETGEKTAFMMNNNLEISANVIEINNSLFKPNVCSYEKDGIYWSFISCTPNVIKVNGCGDIYNFGRPKIDDEKVAEWFVYKSY